MTEKEDKKIKISLAPLQGLTDYIYRNTYAEYFTGIDLSYSPFLRIERGEIRKSRLRDILPENNKGLKMIPQILTNKSEEFLYLTNMLCDKGYEEVNWNLGCPFPMVVRQGMGSGMLQHPDKIKEILDEVMDKVNCKISIKMRNGLDDDSAILDILPILDNYDINEIIIHPRNGKQMYKGDINMDIFRQCLELSSKEISYNGDIVDIESYQQFNDNYPQVGHVMIGRGIIANPFLASEIKGIPTPENKKEIVGKFHDILFERNCAALSGNAHIMSKMTPMWEYLSQSFSNSRKVFKAIKKCSNVKKYEVAVKDILRNEDWIK